MLCTSPATRAFQFQISGRYLDSGSPAVLYFCADHRVLWCAVSCLLSDVPDILEPLLPKSRDVAAADDDLQRDSDQLAGTASDSTGDKQQHVGSTQQSSDLTVFVGEC